MPIVDTSVAVATPSTTAARIKNGSARAGSATTKLRAISRVVARLTLLRSSPRYLQRITKHNKHASTTAGKSPPVKSAAIETPVTEPMVMRTKLGGIVSVCAPVADNSATRSPGLAPRCLISGNSTGATAAISAAFRAGNSGHQIHAADENEMQPAADMTNQIG